MTQEEWDDLRKRTEAVLNTDIKEYNSLVGLLSEYTTSNTLVNQFRNGDPGRYRARLVDVLTGLKDIVHYPKLIDTEEKMNRRYIASVPYHAADEIPSNKPVQPVSAPPALSAWNRFNSYDSYKDQLPAHLRKDKAEIQDWFLERTRLHTLAKNQEIAGVDPDTIAGTLRELVDCEEGITNYFDLIEQFMNGEEVEDPAAPAAGATPSGSYNKEQIDAMTDPSFSIECKLKRIEANRKYIKRDDMKKPKDPNELALRIAELKAWGIEMQ